MRKALIAVVAVVAFAGVLFAAPKAAHVGHHASASDGIDIVSMTRAARALPDQSYPAH
jgi:hypothetical protein